MEVAARNFHQLHAIQAWKLFSIHDEKCARRMKIIVVANESDVHPRQNLSNR